MRFNILIGFLFGMIFLFGQEQELPYGKIRSDAEYDVLGKVRFGAVFPSAYGNNFLADNYNLKTGFQVHVAARIDDGMYLGGLFQGMQGVVVSTNNIGLVESSTITHGFAVLQQRLTKQKSNLQLYAEIGAGYANFRNRVGPRRFADTGWALLFGGELAYRIRKSINIYFSFQNQWSFLRIKASAEQRQFLRNARVIAPSLGIQFYVL